MPMKPPLRLVVGIAAALLCVTMPASRAQDPEAPTPLARAAWLAGCWSGEGLGGQVEECWMRTPDGRLTGAFQFLLEGRQVFNEMVMLAEFEEGIEMRVKHFDPAFEQWESDAGGFVSFPLVEAGESHLQFEGLRYELEGETLTVLLEMHQSDGSTETAVFTMQRK